MPWPVTSSRGPVILTDSSVQIRSAWLSHLIRGVKIVNPPFRIKARLPDRLLITKSFDVMLMVPSSPATVMVTPSVPISVTCTSLSTALASASNSCACRAWIFQSTSPPLLWANEDSCRPASACCGKLGAEACGTRRAGPAATNTGIVASKASVVPTSAALATRKDDGVLFANTGGTIAQCCRGVKAGSGPSQRPCAGSRGAVRRVLRARGSRRLGRCGPGFRGAPARAFLISGEPFARLFLVDRASHQFDHGHGRGIPHPAPRLDDTGVTAMALGEPARQILEQLRHDALGAYICRRAALRMQAPLLT